jgi:hypothetical protein
MLTLTIKTPEWIKFATTHCVRVIHSMSYFTVDNRTLALICQFSCVLFVTFSLLQPLAALAQSLSLTGRWILNAEISTNAADELKGIRKSKRKKHRDPPPANSSDPTSATQERYWQHANEGQQWQRSRELAHAGPIQRLLESANLEIVPSENGYLFIYADGYERQVAPNPGGRVFTASGQEIVESQIGFTLAYVKEPMLFLETRIKEGGQLLEQVSLSDDGNTLTIHIEIDRRDWKWVAKVERVYNRAPL